MGNEQKYEKTAIDILEAVGGRENIVRAAHCATRLRLVLKEEQKADIKKIEGLELVKGQFSNAGQFQVILGAGTVNQVFRYFIEKANIEEVSKTEVKKMADQKLNPIQKLVKLLSDVFVPIIPALIASGLLMGLNNVFTAQGLFWEGKSLVEAYPQIADLASMINTFASAAYAFLPILIGFSAAKIFGGNPYLGAVIGMIMVSGDLLNAYGYGDAILEGTVPTWNILGFSIEKVGYQGTVLPVLLSAFVLSIIEKKLHRVIPEFLDNVLTPLLSVFISAFLTFAVLGGLMRGLGDLITNGLMWLHDTLGAFGGGVLGFVYAPLTMTGMHHSLLPVDIQLVAAGGSFFLALASCNNVAQGGGAIAAAFLTKDKKLKSTATSSGLSCLLGITEPAMFGVNLKLKYPFYAGMIGSAIGGAYATWMNIINVAPGSAGIIGVVSIQNGSMIHFLIGLVIAFVTTIICTILMSKSKRFQANNL